MPTDEPRDPAMEAALPEARKGGTGVSAHDWHQRRTRPDWCARLDHPGVTYNARMDRTWCLCGQVIRHGDVTGGNHLACCGGPLTSPKEKQA